MWTSLKRSAVQFQSTPSVWRETTFAAQVLAAGSFQSTPSVWRETYKEVVFMSEISISIHSLRVEGDCVLFPSSSRTVHFNPLPPCGGRLDATTAADLDRWISIHSLRVEGDQKRINAEKEQKISIHSLRVEGDLATQLKSERERRISIHSLRVEGDAKHYDQLSIVLPFQSTPSVWRETICQNDNTPLLKISIHSLRVEGDLMV